MTWIKLIMNIFVFLHVTVFNVYILLFFCEKYVYLYIHSTHKHTHTYIQTTLTYVCLFTVFGCVYRCIQFNTWFRLTCFIVRTIKWRFLANCIILPWDPIYTCLPLLHRDLSSFSCLAPNVRLLLLFTDILWLH